MSGQGARNRTVGGVYITHTPLEHTPKPTNKLCTRLTTFSNTCTNMRTKRHMPALSLSLSLFFFFVKSFLYLYQMCPHEHLNPPKGHDPWGGQPQRDSGVLCPAGKICFWTMYMDYIITWEMLCRSPSQSYPNQSKFMAVREWKGAAKEPNRLRSRKWVRISVGALLPSETRPSKDKNAQ